MFQLKKTFSLVSLVFFITVSLIVAIFTISDLEWSDRISNGRGSVLFILGLIFFTCLFNALNVFSLHTTTGLRLVKKYKMSVTDVMDISNK